jgi:hypothetical protein
MPFHRSLLSLLGVIVFSFAALTCSGTSSSSSTAADDDATPDDDDNDDASPADDDVSPADDDSGDPILPTAGFLSRQAAYLAACSAAGAPGAGGGLDAQCCRVATGQTTFDEDAINASLTKVNARQDTSDFDMAALLRILYLDNDKHVLPAALRQSIETTVLGFKYWLDETGPDDLCWWSENHQNLYHSAEILAGQLFPTSIFTNSGMTGQQHVAHGQPLEKRWLDMRGLFGFSEFHSNVYFDEDMPALVNLADFAEDPDIALEAHMALDVLNFDFASNYYNGLYATSHGRTYSDHMLNGLSDSTTEAAHIMLGLCASQNPAEFTGTMLATSKKYWPPPIMEDIANDAKASFENKQTDSVNLVNGPKYGIGYTAVNDVIFWWGTTGYVAPDVIEGTFALVNQYDLWKGYLWSGLTFLKPLVGSPLLKDAANLLAPLSQGVELEESSTYTYRTAYYQLSGAQDYKPAVWSAQVLVWLATIDKNAFVTTTYPSLSTGDDGQWTGGWQPRGTYYKNVGVLQYWRPTLPLIDGLCTKYTHAYFQQSGFDQVVQSGNWTIGKKGDSYLALYSQNPTTWSTANDYELIADGEENVWIVELGDATANGEFSQFVSDIENAKVTIGSDVEYDSPSQGLVVVGREGPMTVAGQTVDLGPYDRWDNKYATQAYGTNDTIINFNGERLDLNFQTPSRRYWKHYGD